MNIDPIVERCDVDRSRAFSLLSSMYVERGDKEDWEELHELHYKAEGRVSGRIWRCKMESGQLVGVIIVSSPRLLVKGRHEAFPKLRPTGKESTLANTYRAKYINNNFSVVSRAVVDTLFRASGVSYRMLNLVTRMEHKPYLEIQSSMSKFNPFAIRAGFRFTPPHEAGAFRLGLGLCMRLFKAHPADSQGLMIEINEMTPSAREKTLETVREFYYRHSSLEKTGGKLHTGKDRINGMGTIELMKNFQQLVLAAPMYGIYKNPDFGRTLPERLPLLAFDAQRWDEPLAVL